MKHLSWRWRLSFIVILLIPFLEQARKQLLVIGQWRSIDGKSVRMQYRAGGYGSLFYHGEVIEEYKVKGAVLLEEQWMFERLNGSLKPYAAPGSGNDPENGHRISHLYMDIMGRNMTLCSNDGCSRFERE